MISHQVCVLNCELLVNHQASDSAFASDSGLIEEKEMGVETQVVVCPTTIVPNLDAFVTCSQIVRKTSEVVSENFIRQFIPNIRSGSFSDIGPRRSMEDEHLMIDDLSMHLSSLFRCTKPSAFYGIFDGHRGPQASAYVRNNVTRRLFEETNFLELCQVDEIFLEGMENCFRRAFLLADEALADDCTIDTSSGTTALTALVLGRLLLVANAGDCRAVLCRKGEAIDMSKDHRPTCPSKKRRVEEAGGYVDDEYLNGVLSVSRALGDWDIKLADRKISPLIAEPEVKQIILTEEDEFLIMGCDGIWDVMPSQKAVNIVRQGLRRHDNPEECAKELVREALRSDAFDNLTVVVVCFSRQSYKQKQAGVWRPTRLRFSSLESVANLQNMIDGH